MTPPFGGVTFFLAPPDPPGGGYATEEDESTCEFEGFPQRSEEQSEESRTAHAWWLAPLGVPCNKPLSGYRAPGGQVTFSRKQGWIDRPVTVACGQCLGCRLARSRAWALRCVHEASLHERNCFITLTYDPEHLPHDGGLHVDHWQRFAKRLRKRLPSQTMLVGDKAYDFKFRFFHCGEYGDRTFRPHYHAAMFGVDFSEDSILFKQKADYALRVSPMLTETWGMGHATVGDLTLQSAAYVARYVVKKIGGAAAEQVYSRVDPETGEEFQVKPEYVTMSLKPGIGAGWFEKFGDEVYPEDFVIHEGKKFRPPQYYDREFEKRDPAFMEGVRRARIRRAQKVKESVTPDRLRAKEEILRQRMSQSRDVD